MPPALCPLWARCPAQARPQPLSQQQSQGLSSGTYFRSGGGSGSKHELLLNWNFSIPFEKRNVSLNPEWKTLVCFSWWEICFLIKVLILWEACFFYWNPFSSKILGKLRCWLLYQGHVWLILKDATALGAPHGIHSTTRAPALWNSWQARVSLVRKSIALLNVSALPDHVRSCSEICMTGSGHARGLKG